MSSANRIRPLLSREGNLYKTNLHCHTTVSDGKFSPEEIKRMYMARGYSAVAYTDHRACVPHTELTDSDFVALTGIEHACGIGRATSVHICGISRDPSLSFPLPDEADDSVEAINAAVAHLNSLGFITTLNHPRWSGMAYDSVAAVEGVANMEVVNGFESVLDGYGDSSALYELELRRGRRAYPIASDDSHRALEGGEPGHEYFRGFTVIKAGELSYSALVDALARGDFYASTGPLFHNLWLDGDILHVECSTVSGVYVHGERYSHRAALVEGGDVIECADINVGAILESSRYIFVIITDSKGKTAWSAPLWLDGEK